MPCAPNWEIWISWSNILSSQAIQHFVVSAEKTATNAKLMYLEKMKKDTEKAK
jgi:hypothetical protein